ncbi:MAG: hypothetical protein AB7P02_27165 [Alphaproteobacteria bacterium]
MIQILLAFLVLATLAMPPQPAPDLVTLQAASRPSTCAAEDNVRATLTAPWVRVFRVAIQPPPFIDAVEDPPVAPSRDGCAGAPPPGPGAPRLFSLHADDEIRVLGLAFPQSGRPATVPVRVGDRTFEGLHVVQFVRVLENRGVEFLALDLPEGAWRGRPLPLAQQGDTGYGGSFLVGPIVDGAVDIASVAYLADRRALRLEFRGGAAVEVAVERIDEDTLDLRVAFDRPVADGPFAAYRGMFVAPETADVTEARWMDAEGTVAAVPIMDLRTVEASAVQFGRTRPSLPVPAAPDHFFEAFTP